MDGIYFAPIFIPIFIIFGKELGTFAGICTSLSWSLYALFQK